MKIVKNIFKYTTLVSVISTTILSSTVFAKADDLLGTWLTGEGGKSKVEIYKNGSTYSGKIIWLKEPNRNGKPKTDWRNPDKTKAERPLMGLNLLSSFKSSGDDKWENGIIYNPEDGKEYSCIIKMKDPKTIDVRGYIGISFIGKSQTWTKVK